MLTVLFIALIPTSFAFGWYQGMMRTERQHAQWTMEAFHDDKAAFTKFMNVRMKGMKLKPHTERMYKDLLDRM